MVYVLFEIYLLMSSTNMKATSFFTFFPSMICSCHHELETARINGLLGNIDANTGDPQIGILSESQTITYHYAAL